LLDQLTIKKMNWGNGIFLAMTAFLLFILAMCYVMFSAPDDDYDHQYYEKGLSFDHDYNREKQVYTDKAVPAMAIDGKTLTLTFSQPVSGGSVSLVRPNNAAMDERFALNNASGSKLLIPLKSMAKGKWLVVFDWQAGKKDYLYQKSVYIK
jgi:hypothetical protein